MFRLHINELNSFHKNGFGIKLAFNTIKYFTSYNFRVEFVRDEGFFCISFVAVNNISYEFWLEYGKPAYFCIYNLETDRYLYSIPKWKTSKYNNEKDEWDRMWSVVKNERSY